MIPKHRICDVCEAEFVVPKSSEETSTPIYIPVTDGSGGHNICHECVKTGCYEVVEELSWEAKHLFYGMVVAWASQKVAAKLSPPEPEDESWRWL